MTEFKTCHPLVNFIYFFTTVAFSCLYMHPIFLCISFAAALFSLLTLGKKEIKFLLFFILPFMASAALINPLFNHEGATILSYLPSQNPITLESLIYGGFSALMLSAVIIFFSLITKTLTSERITCLISPVSPSLALLFSMTLSFIPRLSARMRISLSGQKCLHGEASLLQKMKNAIHAVSATVTWSLENAIDTAQSMKSRGHSLSGRTSFSPFAFDNRDRLLLSLIIVLGIYSLIGALSGALHYTYFPTFKISKLSPYSISVFISYTALCFIPFIIECKEALKWKSLKSKT